MAALINPATPIARVTSRTSKRNSRRICPGSLATTRPCIRAECRKITCGMTVAPRMPEAKITASGILGATVMPHVIFLHSALMQGRVVAKDPGQMRRLFRFEVLDVTLAMGVAGLINAAMLIMAAVTFHNPQYNNVGTIQEAHATLAPLLGLAASWVFAISLLAAGLSSSSVGTMSGQVIMQGFLRRHIP